MRSLRISFPRLVLLLGGLGLLTAPLRAEPDRLLRRFEAANEAYAQGEYEQAVDGYRAILDSGVASAALYHNLGNAYVRLDRVGPAVWAYERARQLRPDDPRLEHNLEYVRRRAGLPQIELPPRGLGALVGGWSPLLLFGIGVLVLGAGLLGAVFRAEPNQGLAWRSPMAGAAVGVGLVLVAVALGTSYVQAHERRAVVMPASVPLRAAPDDTAVPDTTVEAGTMLEIRVQKENWIRVRLRDRTDGWVPAGAVGSV